MSRISKFKIYHYQEFTAERLKQLFDDIFLNLNITDTGNIDIMATIRLDTDMTQEDSFKYSALIRKLQQKTIQDLRVYRLNGIAIAIDWTLKKGILSVLVIGDSIELVSKIHSNIETTLELQTRDFPNPE